MAKTFLAVAVASNLIAALLAEWPVNLLVAAGGVAGFAPSHPEILALSTTSPQYPYNRTLTGLSPMSQWGQELTSTGVPTGIERQKRLVRYCRGYLRPSACVVPLNWP
jgi:hypothetical protein